MTPPGTTVAYTSDGSVADKAMGDAREIPEKPFYKIGEVCQYTDTQPYVIRFWESDFPQLSPEKGRSGQRVYRREDIDLILRIKKLLYDEEYTIAGARRRGGLRAELGADRGTLRVQRRRFGEVVGVPLLAPGRRRHVHRPADRTDVLDQQHPGLQPRAPVLCGQSGAPTR